MSIVSFDPESRDDLNRVPLVQHFLSGQTPRFDYGFDVVNRRTFEQRNSASADGYRYDLSGQITNFNRDGALQTDGTVSGGSSVLSIGYDANGNRQYVSDAAPNANGLSATYFNNDNFTGSTISRVDPNVNFTWNAGSPHPSIGPDTFSARWEGQVVPRFSETYTFYTQSDDGVRLWVNGQLPINNWTLHALTENSGTITLVAGEKYDIKLEYFEGTGGAIMKLLWSSASEVQQVIPQGQLRQPASGYIANDLNQYTQVDGKAANYDVKGNLSSYDGWTYTYDELNRLTDVDKSATSGDPGLGVKAYY